VAVKDVLLQTSRIFSCCRCDCACGNSSRRAILSSKQQY